MFAAFSQCLLLHQCPNACVTKLPLNRNSRDVNIKPASSFSYVFSVIALHDEVLSAGLRGPLRVPLIPVRPFPVRPQQKLLLHQCHLLLPIKASQAPRPSCVELGNLTPKSHATSPTHGSNDKVSLSCLPLSTRGPFWLNLIYIVKNCLSSELSSSR